jgi:uncharacterized protein (TIGR02145 family)
MMAAVIWGGLVLAGCGGSASQGAETIHPETGIFTDSRDGTTYRTVKIGRQTWMAKNLNYQTGKSWCYNNKADNCHEYGKLYDWETAMKACPAGWHLPSRDEWSELVNFIGGKEIAGTKLKSTSPNSKDNLWFSALPGGARHTTGIFVDRSLVGYWWTASEYDVSRAYGLSMGANYTSVDESNIDKNYSFSVRCVLGDPPAYAAPALARPTAAKVELDPLDVAIREVSNYFNSNLTKGNKLVIINIQSDFHELSYYIIDELIANTVNDRKFSIVDRKQLDAIRSELQFQMSGEVDDNSAQRAGQILGAQTIIMGAVSKFGDSYRMRIQALDVETARIVGQINRNIPYSPTIAMLAKSLQGANPPRAGMPPSAPANPQVATGTPQTPQVPQVPTGLTAKTQNATEIHLTWNTVAGATSYKIYRALSSDGPYAQIANTNTTAYTNSGLANNTAYYYRVSAMINEWDGRLSTTASAKTLVAPVTPPGTALGEQLAWIANQFGTGTTYDIMLNNDESLGPTTVTTRGRNITIIMRSENPKKSRTVQLKGQGFLFTLDANITLILQNVVLKGHNQNTEALVHVSPGTKLILDSGTKIIGNTSTNNGNNSSGGGVYVNGGILEMNDGVEIRGNTASLSGGGIRVVNNGNVIIRGGLISENTSSRRYGGGIYIGGNSTVSMSGGIISKNNASDGGGGVYVDVPSTFTKRPVPGSETSGIIYGTIGENANKTGGIGGTFGSGGGAVICLSRIWNAPAFAGTATRNATLGDYDEISSESEEGWGK